MSQIDTLIDLIDTVVADLQARADYSGVSFTVGTGSTSAPEAVKTFGAFKQALLIQKAKGTAAPDDETDAAATLAAAIIDANVKIQKMGQLSTSRTIEPSTAQADNVHLRALHDALMAYKANPTGAGGGGSGPSLPYPVPPMPDGPAYENDMPDIDHQYP